MQNLLKIVVAGPVGAGKTTFAKDFLPEEGNCINYINFLIPETLCYFLSFVIFEVY